jgi:DnaJ family protein C protein 28
VTERLIREAQEAGAFDDLPGRGRPLDLDDDPREGELGLAFHILRTNDAVPPWIAADGEARRCANDIERLMADASRIARREDVTPMTRARLQARLARLADEHDHAVEALDATAPSATLHRRRLSCATLEARLGRILDGQSDEAPRT